jgi:hypothetical protein
MSYHATPTKPTQPGFVLIVVTATIATLLFLAGYFLEQSTSEIRIAKSENAATKSYYLAEAGANEAVYKLKNDTNWRTKFLDGTLANETATRSNVFDTYGSYTISATSVSDALADITITANYSSGGQQAKRVIRTRLARATNPASTWSQSFYAGGTGGQQNGDITTERNCTINGGVLHANQNFKVTSQSTLTVNNATVSSSNNIVVNAGSSLVLNDSTQTEGTPAVGMPQVDFDSSSPTSLKNRADQIYTSAAFQNLPSGTVLNGITFVTGDASWTNKNLTINGILASSDDIHFSLNSGKTVTISSSASGSGILSKDDINISLTGSTFSLNGLVYASEEVEIETSGSVSFSVTGGIVGWHVKLEGSDSGTCTITYDDTLASQPLDPVYNGSESPIIEVNHWEEQY